jgi:SAM-dependent methyltransferase
MERYGQDYYYGRKLSNYLCYDSIDTSKQFNTVISFIRKNNLKGNYLDVGCAFGLLLKETSKDFDRVYGCDVSDFAISKARSNAKGADLKVVDIEKPLPYPDGYFDLVTAMDVLEHTTDLEMAYGNIVRKVRQGGYLIMSMPIDEWPRKLMGFCDRDKTHVSVLPERHIDEIIRKSGMSVLSKRLYVPFPLVDQLPYIPAEVEYVMKNDAGAGYNT